VGLIHGTSHSVVVKSFRITREVGPPGFEPGTNRFLNALSAYEPGALTWLSYGPTITVSVIMLFSG
jgi:hypothetical protein